MTTNEIARNLRAAVAFLEDGAPADALRCVTRTIAPLYEMVVNRYVRQPGTFTATD